MFSTSIDRKRFVIFRIGNESSVKFSQEGDKEVYVFTNPETFSDYIALLLQHDATVVSIFHSLHELLPQLRFLGRFTSEASYHEEYMATYRDVLSEIQGSRVQQAVLARGQRDIPLACRLMLAVDARGLNQDHLGIPDVKIQQYLRVIAFKHGAQVFAVDTNAFLADPLGNLPTQEAKPVFDFDSRIKLNIPVAWDSWAKITLVAKSAMKTEDGTLDTEQKIREFDEEYATYFETGNTGKVLSELESRQ